MASYTLINPDGSRQTVKYSPSQDGPVSQRLSLIKKIKWLKRKAEQNPFSGSFRRQIIKAQRRLSAFDLSLSNRMPRTRQPARTVGVPQPVHTTGPQQGHRDQPGSRSVAGEKTSCKAAASLGSSTPSQTGLTRHTPSSSAAPTQSLYTADAGGSEAMSLQHGI